MTVSSLLRLVRSYPGAATRYILYISDRRILHEVNSIARSVTFRVRSSVAPSGSSSSTLKYP